jgi:hypothetical protein
MKSAEDVYYNYKMARDRVYGVSDFGRGVTAECQIVGTDVNNDLVWREVDYPAQFFPKMLDPTPDSSIENDFARADRVKSGDVLSEKFSQNTCRR